jgi:aspartate/methionine/tyrosine aminotransferase
MRYAERMNQLGTETAFEVLAKARALEAKGKTIVHLEIGEPDFDTPATIRAAAIRAIEEGFTHYGPSAGLPEVRESIAGYISKDRGLPVTMDQVVVTPGGKPVLTFAVLACVDPGDEVIVPNPDSRSTSPRCGSREARW